MRKWLFDTQQTILYCVSKFHSFLKVFESKRQVHKNQTRTMVPYEQVSVVVVSIFVLTQQVLACGQQGEY